MSEDGSLWGMSGLNQANVLAISGRAVETSGDADVLMLTHLYTVLIRTEIFFYPLYSICLILKTG